MCTHLQAPQHAENRTDPAVVLSSGITILLACVVADSLIDTLRLSAVLAWLGLKAMALAWLEAAAAFSTHRPGQSCQPGSSSGLAWPRLWLLYAKCSIFFYRSVGHTRS